MAGVFAGLVSLAFRMRAIPSIVIHVPYVIRVGEIRIKGDIGYLVDMFGRVYMSCLTHAAGRNAGRMAIGACTVPYCLVMARAARKLILDVFLMGVLAARNHIREHGSRSHPFLARGPIDLAAERLALGPR